MPFEEVTFLGAGVNHQSFILRFERDGEDLYPALDAAIAADPELRRKVRVELYQRFGYFPTESSEHSAEYLPWLMRDDAALERFRVPVDEYIRRSEENLGVYEDMRRSSPTASDFEIEQSLEYAPLIVHAMVTGAAAGHLRQRAQRRADRQPARGRLRRGAVRRRPDRRAADARSVRCRRSSRR